jgi:hypothetical protein
MHQPKTVLSWLLVFSFLTLPQAFADQKKITLKDGSVIVGELESFNNGTYTVKTANLGDLELPEANVMSVASASFTPPPAAAQAPQAGMPQTGVAPAMGGSNFSNQVASMQNQIMSNPGTMQAVQAMAEDPEIMNMLSDPAFTQQLTAAMSGQGDPQALANNPKIQKLMANPKMQALIQQVHPGAIPQQQ